MDLRCIWYVVQAVRSPFVSVPLSHVGRCDTVVIAVDIAGER